MSSTAAGMEKEDDFEHALNKSQPSNFLHGPSLLVQSTFLQNACFNDLNPFVETSRDANCPAKEQGKSTCIKEDSSLHDADPPSTPKSEQNAAASASEGPEELHLHEDDNPPTNDSVPAEENLGRSGSRTLDDIIAAEQSTEQCPAKCSSLNLDLPRMQVPAAIADTSSPSERETNKEVPSIQNKILFAATQTKPDESTGSTETGVQGANHKSQAAWPLETKEKPPIILLKANSSSSISNIFSSSILPDKLCPNRLSTPQDFSHTPRPGLGYTPEFDFYSTGGTGGSGTQHVHEARMHQTTNTKPISVPRLASVDATCTSSIHHEILPDFSIGRNITEPDQSVGAGTHPKAKLDMCGNIQEESGPICSMSEFGIQVEFGDNSQDGELDPLSVTSPESCGNHAPVVQKNRPTQVTSPGVPGINSAPQKHSIDSLDAKSQMAKFYAQRELSKKGKTDEYYPESFRKFDTHFKSCKISQIQDKMSLKREPSNLLYYLSFCLLPPPLPDQFRREQTRLLCLAQMPFDHGLRTHVSLLQALYSGYTGCLDAVPPIGDHWEIMGFQGQDPATDLRGAGILGLWFMLNLHNHHPQNAAAIYQLASKSKQPFPFALVCINAATWTVQMIRSNALNSHAVHLHGLIKTAKLFHVGTMYEFYRQWTLTEATMEKAGYVIKEVKSRAQMNVKEMIGFAHQEDIRDPISCGKDRETCLASIWSWPTWFMDRTSLSLTDIRQANI